MEALTLVAASGLVLITAVAATALLRPQSITDAAVTIGVLATGEIAVLTGVTGALGHLRPGVVVAAALVLAVVVVVIARDRLARLPRPRVDRGAIRRHPWVALLVVVAVAGLAWQVLVAVVLPVYAYDALTYHGTTLATWLQRGDIATPELSECCKHFPNTAELESIWPMLLLQRDTLVDAVQIAFVVLGAAAVAGIARSAGLARSEAVAAAAIFVSTPIVLAQSSTNYVDVMVIGWALAALHCLVRFAVTRDVLLLVPFATATGLLIGTKGTGIVWGAVLALSTVAVAAVSVRRGWLRAVVAVRALLVVAVLSGALGSFWYVRNWIETGNPLYPFAIQVAGVEIFDGPTQLDKAVTAPDVGRDASWPEAVARSWAADLDFWNQGPYDYQQRAGGLGPAWAWLGLPLLVPIGVVLLRRRSAAAIAFAVVGVTFAIQPYRWWSRFTIQLAALGAVAIVAAIAWVPSRAGRAALRMAALGLTIVGVLLTSYAVNPASRAPALPARELLRLAGEPASTRTVGRIFFPEYRFVDDMPADATVIVDLPAPQVRFVYPLFGPSWSRRVLDADASALTSTAWVVTGAGRPLDARMQRDARFVLDADVRGVRVWRPRAGRG